MKAAPIVKLSQEPAQEAESEEPAGITSAGPALELTGPQIAFTGLVLGHLFNTSGLWANTKTLKRRARDELGISGRTFYRYRRILEAAGLVVVLRSYHLSIIEIPGGKHTYNTKYDTIELREYCEAIINLNRKKEALKEVIELERFISRSGKLPQLAKSI